MRPFCRTLGNPMHSLILLHINTVRSDLAATRACRQWGFEMRTLPSTDPHAMPPPQLSVSGGDIAPLMGHNAFLRWDALQQCAFVDPADGVRKFWSEAHVSEDFDCALRFQVSCFLPRDPGAACLG